MIPAWCYDRLHILAKGYALIFFETNIEDADRNGAIMLANGRNQLRQRVEIGAVCGRNNDFRQRKGPP
jgi:hypothetical protein